MWSRNALAILGVLALGYWFGNTRAVSASSTGSNGFGVQFQLTGINESSSLLVYQPETKTVYVYRGATTGNSALQCSYKYQMDRPGGVIQRTPCDVQQLIP
jgi:hypothetical protein